MAIVTAAMLKEVTTIAVATKTTTATKLVGGEVEEEDKGE